MRYLVILLILSNLSFARTITVCRNCEINSIAKGVEKSQANDTVLVKGGLYKENNIKIEHPLVVIGKNNPVIDGSKGGHIFYITAPDVTIKGFTFKNIPVDYLEEHSGVYAFNTHNITVEDNTFINTFFAIYLARVVNGVVRHNKITGNAKTELQSGNGIHLWYSDRCVVEHNYIRQQRDGIYLEYVTNSKFFKNFSEYNIRYGMHFMFSDTCEYYNNTFQKNGAGVAVMFSRKIKMKHNNFLDNWGASAYGLLLKEIYDGDIYYNKFVRNTTGVYGESATRCIFKYNEFVNNGYAIVFMGSCNDNVFTNNNFLFNTFDLSSTASLISNKFTLNYWSDYVGYDLDKDGIGDVPYRPINLFTFIVTRVPESLVLLRSLFVDLLNLAEKITPIFISENIKDDKPLMKPYVTSKQPI